MPFVRQDEIAGPRVPMGQDPEPLKAPEQTSALELFSAGFRAENPEANTIRWLADAQGYTPVPGYNPWDDIPEEFRTRKDMVQRYVYSQSPAETSSITRRIEEETETDRILDAAGTAGWLARVIGGTVSITNLLPGGALYRSLRMGQAALRTAGSVGAASGAAAAVQEGILLGTQETRTFGQAGLNVASATVLGAVLGSAAGAVGSRAEWNRLVSLLDQDRSDIAKTTYGTPTTTAAGAAAADTRKVEVRGFGTEHMMDAQRQLLRPNPIDYTITSPLVSARRAAADLAATSLTFKENVEGVPIANSPPVDILASVQIDKGRIVLHDELRRLYGSYRFGDEATRFAPTRAHLERFAGRDDRRLSYREFKDQIDLALRSGDQHAIPQVAEAAKIIRQEILEPWKDAAARLGMLPEDVEPETALSYMTRIWNREAITQNWGTFITRTTDWLEAEQARKASIKQNLETLSGRLDDALGEIDTLQARLARADAPDDLAETLARAQRQRDEIKQQIEEQLTQWQGKSAADAISAMKIRDDAADGRATDAPRLTQADRAVSRAVKRIIASDRDLTRADLESRAEQIANRILSTPDGRLPYDAPSGGPRVGPPVEREAPRGPLAAREFMIPDELIREFLDTDVERTVDLYLRTMVPDVLLTARFGDTQMTEAFKRIQEEASAAMKAAKTGKEADRIRRERDAVITRLAGMRDRIRGTYGYSDGQVARNIGRIAQGVRRANLIRVGGSLALSSIPDVAGIVARYGANSVFRNAYAPLIRSLANPETRGAMKAFKRQARALGIAAETTLAMRMDAIADISDIYRPGNAFERTLYAASDRLGLVNLLAWETDFAKTMASMVISSEMIRAVRSIATTGKAAKKQVLRLAENFIDAPMADRIWKQLDSPGGMSEVDGVMLPNTAEWTDAGARTAFEAALRREADIAVVTPGQDKPLWMSGPVGATVGQFKSFFVSATPRILLANLQQRDAHVLQGFLGFLALGMVAEWAYGIAAGRTLPDTPEDWIKAGISRSGILGWLEEVNAAAALATRGQVDLYRLTGSNHPLTRYVSRNVMGQIAGPVAGAVEDLVTVTGAASSGDWRASDTSRLRRMLPFQNLVYIRQLLDEVEDGVNKELGVQ